MPISAEGPSRSAPAMRGFTLLEIMASVFIIGIIILPFLTTREEAQARAYRSQRMIEAANHGREFVARRMRDIVSVREERGVLEEDPTFRYEFTLENFDLSTGYGEDEENADDPYAEYPGPLPPDAQLGDEEEERTPYKVRRYVLVLTWDGYAEESEEERFVLEGYLPRIWDPDTSTVETQDP